MTLFGRFVRSTSGKVAVAVLVSVAISVPASVWAVTTFTDVATSHPFHKEISAVAGAGIAQGFSDGTYRPGNDITRQAMAAFMERGVGRAVSAESWTYVESSVESEVVAVSMDAGAAGAGTKGFVRVSGSVWAMTIAATSTNCPCTVSVHLFDGDISIANSMLQVPKLPDGPQAVGTTSLETVVPVDGDSGHMYRMVVSGANTFGGGVSAYGQISATYVPLSGDGDSTADYGLTCPKNDTWEPNDTKAAASRYFMSSAHLTNAVVCPSDEDWFYDAVGLGDPITVNLSFSHAEGDIDVCLHEVALTLICSTGTSDEETINYGFAPAGTYWVQVYLASDTGSTPGNTYTMSISKSP